MTAMLLAEVGAAVGPLYEVARPLRRVFIRSPELFRK